MPSLLHAETEIAAQPSPTLPFSVSSWDLSNYQSLIARAVDVFADEVKAAKWLSVPNPDLGGQTPLQRAQGNGYDPAVLEPLFIQIEHGLYA